MGTIKTGIVGSAGYAGGELIRLLLGHPGADLVFAYSKSHAGKFLYEVHQDLIGETDQRFTAGLTDGIDVLFLCLGHGEAKKFLEEHTTGLKDVKIIDLSQDHRLTAGAGQPPVIKGQPVVYGLPELNREQIKSARHVANPGCFATAIQLGLLPLAKAGLLTEVHVTGITGSTGAGQGMTATSQFSWRASNIQAYKTLSHQHIGEITQSVKQLQPSFAAGIHFVPWRGDFARGIFVSSQLDCESDEGSLIRLYEDFYRDHPFTVLSHGPIFLKQAVNNNKCIIQLEKIANKLVVHSAIDNLLKGASGQAVQNMNLLCGLDEPTGLKLKGTAF
jgi:N-acetyl-gamma-glutamyl-phosphate reductase